MSALLHQLISTQAKLRPNQRAIGCKDQWLTYQQLQTGVEQVSQALLKRGLTSQQRVAVYLPKTIETVQTMFATSRARGVFVPINPVLKAAQAGHILQDSQTRILVTNHARWRMLHTLIPDSVQLVVVLDLPKEEENNKVISWRSFLASVERTEPQIASKETGLETDVAAIFYTSGSTGKPKGVVLSQRNMVLGAASVAEYLESTPEDRMLAALPLSFDYGFSQLSIAFTVGASCYLLEFLFAKDIIKAVQQQAVTCLALVPPLWIKLAEAEWPAPLSQQIRYFTNSGGVMPSSVLTKLQQLLPKAKPYLMYGLTEAFRSCYLPPEDVAAKPGSFGKAIPNAEIKLINAQGKECQPYEEGELVHCGPLVSLGYWNDEKKTAERFKPEPNLDVLLTTPKVAVWSGDIVTKDEQGYFYFVGRNDDMIKTSGYRVSPTEIEEVIDHSKLAGEAVALGVSHPVLGQAILLLVVVEHKAGTCINGIQKACSQALPNYMQPQAVIAVKQLPRNPNGKCEALS